jgi:hypothetical protein
MDDARWRAWWLGSVLTAFDRLRLVELTGRIVPKNPDDLRPNPQSNEKTVKTLGAALIYISRGSQEFGIDVGPAIRDAETQLKNLDLKAIPDKTFSDKLAEVSVNLAEVSSKCSPLIYQSLRAKSLNKWGMYMLGFLLQVAELHFSVIATPQSAGTGYDIAFFPDQRHILPDPGDNLGGKSLDSWIDEEDVQDLRVAAGGETWDLVEHSIRRWEQWRETALTHLERDSAFLATRYSDVNGQLEKQTEIWRSLAIGEKRPIDFLRWEQKVWIYAIPIVAGTLALFATALGLLTVLSSHSSGVTTVLTLVVTGGILTLLLSYLTVPVRNAMNWAQTLLIQRSVTKTPRID